MSKWVGITMVGVATALALGLAVLRGVVHHATERRITAALLSHYEPAGVDVIDRKDWHFDGGRSGSFDVGGQICFLIDVHRRSGPARRVAMVADGDDGGAFRFVREYRSFAQCTNDFSRG